jgi:DcmR-like sensory protein
MTTQGPEPAERSPRSELAVPDGQHICLLYADDDERLRLIAAFLSAGRRTHRKLLYITHGRSVDDARARFAELNVDLGEETGAELKTTADAYFPDGRFDPDRMCDGLDAFSRDAVSAGFAGCRCSGEMDWATLDVPGAERLLEYETMLTDMIEVRPFSGVCQYDVRLFDGHRLLDIVAVHPFLLVGGQVLRNPNFVRREEFRTRRAPADAHPL